MATPNRVLVLALALSLPALAAPPKRTTFVLQHQPMALKFKPPPPTVLVHFAKGWQQNGAQNLIFHFHGIMNCVAATVEKTGSVCPGSGPGTPHNLIEQLDKSGANAILVAVEVAYRQNNTDAGNLVKQGFFGSMVDDTLKAINGLKGTSYSRSDIGKLILTSHSGGYEALIESAVNGGVDVAAIFLMDSLYPDKAKCSKNPRACKPADKLKNDDCFKKYFDWVKGGDSRRFIDIYSQMGGTLKNSQQLATDLAGAGLTVETLKSAKQNDKKVADSVLDNQILFLYSNNIHDQIPREWFGRVIPHLLQ
jgi:hypothetical protein